MLEIVFGCTKFHGYIRALPKINVETDHKPLESILRKPLHQTPIRLQRIIMSIQKYALIVEYKIGKQLYIADTLSQAPLPQMEDFEFPQYNINVLSNVLISRTKLITIKQETLKDKSLQELIQTIKRAGQKRSKTRHQQQNYTGTIETRSPTQTEYCLKVKE